MPMRAITLRLNSGMWLWSQGLPTLGLTCWCKDKKPHQFEGKKAKGRGAAESHSTGQRFCQQDNY